MPSSRPTGPITGRKATLRASGAAIIAAALALSCPAAGAEERGLDVVGCDTLVALRVLGIGAASSMATEKAPVDQPGCRRIPRGDLGEVRQRAMIGGAPFECLALRGSEACAWVAP